MLSDNSSYQKKILKDMPSYGTLSSWLKSSGLDECRSVEVIEFYWNDFYLWRLRRFRKTGRFGDLIHDWMDWVFYRKTGRNKMDDQKTVH